VNAVKDTSKIMDHAQLAIFLANPASDQVNLSAIPAKTFQL
jgi:hypothetical protein